MSGRLRLQLEMVRYARSNIAHYCRPPLLQRKVHNTRYPADLTRKVKRGLCVWLISGAIYSRQLTTFWRLCQNYFCSIFAIMLSYFNMMFRALMSARVAFCRLRVSGSGVASVSRLLFAVEVFFG